MFTRATLQCLLRHMEWADARIWAAAPLDTPPDERLKGLLVHMHVVQRAFLTVWNAGEWMEVYRKPDEFATLLEVYDWSRGYYADAQRVVGSFSEEQLGRELQMPWAGMVEQSIGRPPASTTLAETCFQVTSHTTHHRGQVCSRLRELGIEPPLVDYIAWIWFDRPQAEWKV